MSKAYLNMSDEELLNEIHRVENINHNYQTHKYLERLHKEWALRKREHASRTK